MARSALSDPLDRFRFKVIVIEDILASQGANILSILKSKTPPGLGGGFSEIQLPKADTGVIVYRENLHATRFIKKPGLTRYEPISFKRGATSSLELYNWFSLVNNDAIGYSLTSELVGNALQLSPAYPANFRKDLIITSVDREGNAIKSWVVLDAFPVSYKPGDFDANANEKLISELSIAFESFVEIPQDKLSALTDAADQAAANASIAAALGFTFSGGKSGGGFF